jgi:hypothetical protein
MLLKIITYIAITCTTFSVAMENLVTTIPKNSIEKLYTIQRWTQPEDFTRYIKSLIQKNVYNKTTKARNRTLKSDELHQALHLILDDISKELSIENTEQAKNWIRKDKIKTEDIAELFNIITEELDTEHGSFP